MDLDVGLAEEVRQVFGHALGERGHQHAFAARSPLRDLLHQIVDLPAGRLDLDLRVEQTRRSDQLLRAVHAHHAVTGAVGRRRFESALPIGHREDRRGLRLCIRDARDGVLVRPRRGRDVEHLPQALLVLVEHQRPVIHGGRQAEAELDQHLLARAVAVVHTAHLRNGHVRLVDETDEVVGEVVEQRPGRAASLAPRQVPRVVLDTRAGARLGQHLEVVLGTLAQPLRLEQLVLLLEQRDLLFEFGGDVVQRRVEFGAAGHEVPRGIDLDRLTVSQHLTRQRINLGNALELVTPERDAHDDLLGRGMDLERVAAHAELAGRQIVVVAFVIDVG